MNYKEILEKQIKLLAEENALQTLSEGTRAKNTITILILKKLVSELKNNI